MSDVQRDAKTAYLLDGARRQIERLRADLLETESKAFHIIYTLLNTTVNSQPPPPIYDDICSQLDKEACYLRHRNSASDMAGPPQN